MAEHPAHTLRLHSTVTAGGELRLELTEVDVPTPRADQVVVRVEAAPVNPSDLGLLHAGADLAAAHQTGSADRPVITAPLGQSALAAMAARIDQPLPVGNEAAGVVVAAGSSAAAQALLGRVVAMIGGAMYVQHRCVDVSSCLVLPEGTSPAAGASAFVNPLTALGMVETMRREGHHALVHTAAASNLGQMLARIARADGFDVVHVVRRPEQAALLRGLGATHVCDSSADTFLDDLTDAVAATGATLAFDAIGGGPIAGQLLGAMEAALRRAAPTGGYSRYGSDTHKQVYIYGSLDRRPTEVARTFGMAWGIGGWLLFPFLATIGPEAGERLRQRVAAEITTTFASTYSDVVSMAGLLHLDQLRRCARQATATKFLLEPHRDR